VPLRLSREFLAAAFVLALILPGPGGRQKEMMRNSIHPVRLTR
jgi:hypothetical protein